MEEHRPLKRLRGPRAVIVALAGAAVVAGLVLPTAAYPGKLPPDTPDPELDTGLRLLCAAAVLAAFTLVYFTFARKREEPLAMSTLPGLIVTGVVLRYLVVSLPSAAHYQPAARIVPGTGAWVLLAAGLAMTATGIASAFAVKSAT